VFTETLAHVFGAISKTSAFEVFEIKRSESTADIARLAGARMVFASEGDANKPLSAALIKRLTGQDTVVCRHLYHSAFEYSPRFLAMLSTNHRPVVSDASEGYWRRVKMIPFRRFFTEAERDRGLHAALREEAEGILAWAVRGAVEYYRDGLRVPASVENETREYRKSQDRLGEFVEACLVITGDASDTVPIKAVMGAYKDWAMDEHEEFVLGRTRVVRELLNRNGISKRSAEGYSERFTGMRLREKAPAMSLRTSATMPLLDMEG